MPRKIDPDKPLFTIGAVADILGIKPRMLRFYEERGLVEPSRTDGNRRLYSLKDIDLLAYIQYLTCVKKVNVSGVLEIQRILKMLDTNTHSQFMEQIDYEIEHLPADQKRAFSAPADGITKEMLDSTDNCSENGAYTES